MVGQSVQERRRELLVAGKDRDPFGKRQVGRDRSGPPFVPIADELKQELATRAVEGDEAELVNDQQVLRPQPALETAELARIARFDQLPDEVGRADKEDPAFLFRRSRTWKRCWRGCPSSKSPPP